jgi:UDP-glucose 4-epimerase
MNDRALAGQSILITGGAGFVGSHLADALTPQADVTVVDDLSNGHREYVPDAAEFIEADLSTFDALDELVASADIVFHEAALPSVDRSIETPLDAHAINTDATLELLECARRHNTRVVTASSAAIYGIPESLPLTETAPKEPTSPYGIDKLTIDHYTRRYHDLYGLDTVALRYFNIYGPRQTDSAYAGVIPIFLEQAWNDEPITADGDGTQTRDFVYIDDIVQANLRAAMADAVGEAYNIGTGTETSVLDLAEGIQETTDTKSAIVHTDPRPADIDHSVADISKAREQLGYEPHVSLREGVASLAARTG